MPEGRLGELPFETFEVVAGVEGHSVRVATLKAVVALTAPGEDLPPKMQQLLDSMMTPRAFIVRVYVLRGLRLKPADVAGTSELRHPIRYLLPTTLRRYFLWVVSNESVVSTYYPLRYLLPTAIASSILYPLP